MGRGGKDLDEHSVLALQRRVVEDVEGRDVMNSDGCSWPRWSISLEMSSCSSLPP